MSEVPTTGSLVWRLSMKWRVAVDRAVARFGLTHAQYTVLASLAGLSRSGVRPSQRQLAEFCGLEPVYVSRLVSALAWIGYIHRVASTSDPRAVELTLTFMGDNMADQAIAAVRDLQDELLAPIGGANSAQTRALNATLQTLLEHHPKGDSRR